jgi:hypothetical protein
MPVSWKMSINVKSLCGRSLRPSPGRGRCPNLSIGCALSSTRGAPRTTTALECPTFRGGPIGLVTPIARRGREGPRALVTQEVVAREDVVHLEAVGAGIALAYIALEESGMAHGLLPFTVGEAAFGGGAPARLAGTRRLHEEGERVSQGRSRQGAIMRVQFSRNPEKRNHR